MGVDARTCQDEEVLNAFPHGVFKEPKVLRTASAVPWNHFFCAGLWLAANTCRVDDNLVAHTKLCGNQDCMSIHGRCLLSLAPA